ncbi:MAG: hypothetical protein WCP34_08950 [Pseudomonadota bacterium]
MPYFIYRIHVPRLLEYIDAKDSYVEARALARGLRAELPKGQQTTMVRMLFASTSGEAERLLSTPRDERVIGED